MCHYTARRALQHHHHAAEPYFKLRRRSRHHEMRKALRITILRRKIYLNLVDMCRFLQLDGSDIRSLCGMRVVQGTYVIKTNKHCFTLIF
jgi:hypothetical protein